jgi:hypothetical protein
VDVGEEGAQEEIIVDGDGSKHASQQALYWRSGLKCYQANIWLELYG